MLKLNIEGDTQRSGEIPANLTSNQISELILSVQNIKSSYFWGYTTYIQLLDYITLLRAIYKWYINKNNVSSTFFQLSVIIIKYF